ncbi:MAG: hypothetical protein RBT45_08100 [Acholeplasmataceae bacterium]|jgi:hypothetical protein|nr:hypothetical protein [Acholeplasmataceae bacterium]
MSKSRNKNQLKKIITGIGFLAVIAFLYSLASNSGLLEETFTKLIEGFIEAFGGLLLLAIAIVILLNLGKDKNN